MEEMGSYSGIMALWNINGFSAFGFVFLWFCMYVESYKDFPHLDCILFNINHVPSLRYKSMLCR